VISAHRADAVRRAERAAMAGLPQDELMLRAAAALARAVVRELGGRAYGRRVVLLVGAGSNGGDALHAGARLARRGAAVTAVLVADQAHAGGLAALRAEPGARVLAAGADGVEAALARAEVLVDGVVGLGGRPGLPPEVGALLLAAPSALVVAVDVPSGVEADSGRTEALDPGLPEVVAADLTLTFGTAKPGLLVPPGRAAAGRVEVVDIGLDPAALGPAAVEQLEAADVASLWPVPHGSSDKYSRGVLGVVAGGEHYTGAAVLCTGAAVRSGAGMVRYLGPPRPTEIIRERWPEVVPGAGRVQAWAVGPGVDPDDGDQAPRVADALASGLPCLVDAGALPALAARVREHGPVSADVLLTPHAGELARLLAELDTELGPDVGRALVEARPLLCVVAAAEATGATVLLKGATTLVAAPGGTSTRVRAQSDGVPWLGTAGAGDVLAGIAGALLAAGLSPLDAGSVAAAVHGRAARAASGGGPLHAGAVSAAVPAVVAHLLTTGEWT